MELCTIHLSRLSRRVSSLKAPTSPPLIHPARGPPQTELAMRPSGEQKILGEVEEGGPRSRRGAGLGRGAGVIRRIKIPL